MITAELTFHRQTWRRPYRILNVLCTDNKRRNLTITSELDGTGWARGFVSVEGHSVTGNAIEDRQANDWRFAADITSRNGHLLPIRNAA